MSKSAQRFFIVRVVGIGANFATKTGGDITASVTKAWDGGAKRADNIPGSSEIENITVGRTYDPDRDGVLLERLRDRVGEFTSSIVVTPTDRRFIRSSRAKPTVYDDCVLVRIKEPDVDASSSDPATFELEFAVGDVR